MKKDLEDEIDIIVVLLYRLQDELNEILTEDEQTNDYKLSRRLQQLAKEFNDLDIEYGINSEDYDLEDNLRVFLQNKLMNLKMGWN